MIAGTSLEEKKPKEVIKKQRKMNKGSSSGKNRKESSDLFRAQSCGNWEKRVRGGAD